MADHAHELDGPSAESYEQLRPGSSRHCSTVRPRSASTAATRLLTTATRLAAEKIRLEQLAGPVRGQRYHFLRLDPDRNLADVEAAGFAYDSTLGFNDAPRLPGRDRPPIPALEPRAR